MSTNQTQYVTLVSGGGVPVRLADQRGAPYPTTGQGKLVFNEAPTFEGPVTIDGDLIVTGEIPGVITGLTVKETNGFAGDVTTGAAAEITMKTTISGMLKGDGTAISAAVPGTDYLRPSDVTGVYLPLAGGLMSGPINSQMDLTGANTPALNITQTWNNAATGFMALNVNVVDTASATNSYLGMWSVGGAPRVWFSKVGSLGLNGSAAVAAGQLFYWTSRSIMSSPADSVIRLTNFAQTDFNRLQFGGTTNAFPSIKRVAAALNFVYADDSGYTPIGTNTLTVNPALATEATEGGQIDWKSGTTGTYNLSTDIYNNTWRAYGARKSDAAVATLWTMQLDGTGWAIAPPVTLTGALTGTTANFSDKVFTDGIDTTADQSQYALLAGRWSAGFNYAALNTKGAYGWAFQVNSATQLTLDATSAQFFGALTGTTATMTGLIRAFSGTAIPAGGTQSNGINFSSIANFGIMHGSGLPTAIMARGSWYMRSDATAATGIYVNTDGTGTGWAVVAGGGGGSGTVTSVSVVSANGLAGTVATATLTPAITLSTTINGMLKGNGTAISAAVAGTDYSTPASVSASLASYLPLAGGTLTGPLTGTSATFNGDVTANSYVAQSAAGNPRLLFNRQANAVDARRWVLTDFSDGNFYLQPTTDADVATQTWSFLRNGSTTLPGALTGTTAAFDQYNSTTTLTGASTPALNITQTWNNAATGFTALNVNAIDTASTASSYLAQFQVSGSPRVWFSKTGSITCIASLSIGTNSLMYWTSKSIMSSPVDGQIRLTNQAQTDFSRLQFGGTTSAFPSIKRNLTALNFRTADDTADVPITAGDATFTGNVASTVVSATAPASPIDRQLWFNSDASPGGGQLMIRYNDGSTTQWLPVSPSISTLPGALMLYSEALGTGSTAFLNVTFPSNAKAVELRWYLETAADSSFTIRGSVGGVPDSSAKYHFHTLVQATTVVSGGTAYNQVGWNLANDIQFWGSIRFHRPTLGFGEAHYMRRSAAATRSNTVTGLETDMSMTPFNGYYFTSATGNFTANSYLRCFVVI